MGYKLLQFLIIIMAFLFILNCSKSTPPNFSQQEIETETNDNGTGRIIIKDGTGKRWDVTHACLKYGLKPEKFQFGLGPYAILPIINPKFAEEGSPDYPNTSLEFLTLGFKMGNDIRAYPTFIMSSFEVANDWFGGTPVTVGY